NGELSNPSVGRSKAGQGNGEQRRDLHFWGFVCGMFSFLIESGYKRFRLEDWRRWGDIEVSKDGDKGRVDIKRRCDDAMMSETTASLSTALYPRPSTSTPVYPALPTLRASNQPRPLKMSAKPTV